jgi:hypothetical protein
MAERSPVATRQLNGILAPVLPKSQISGPFSLD